MSTSTPLSATPNPGYKPYHDPVNYLLVVLALLPWIFIGKRVFATFHGDFSKVAGHPAFFLFNVEMLLLPVVIAMCSYNVGRWSRISNWMLHLCPGGLTLAAFLLVMSPERVSVAVEKGEPATVVPVKKVIDPAVVQDIARELTDSGVLVRGQLHVDWRNSAIPAVMNTLDNYRSTLLERIIARDTRAGGLEKEYFAAVSVMDDPLTAMHKQLQLVCELEAAIARVACCHDLGEVDRLFSTYNLPLATTTITYAGDMAVSLQTLRGFLTDRIQSLENGHIQVSLPDDYPRKPCALKDLQFIVIENPTT
ncbi:MAG TPA: hypothetical protein VGS79_02985 [Puia sp.]|nr:hypothetical protein [Puia sp.]